MVGKVLRKGREGSVLKGRKGLEVAEGTTGLGPVGGDVTQETVGHSRGPPAPARPEEGRGCVSNRVSGRVSSAKDSHTEEDEYRTVGVVLWKFVPVPLSPEKKGPDRPANVCEPRFGAPKVLPTRGPAPQDRQLLGRGATDGKREQGDTRQLRTGRRATRVPSAERRHRREEGVKDIYRVEARSHFPSSPDSSGPVERQGTGLTVAQRYTGTRPTPGETRRWAVGTLGEDQGRGEGTRTATPEVAREYGRALGSTSCPSTGPDSQGPTGLWNPVCRFSTTTSQESLPGETSRLSVPRAPRVGPHVGASSGV